MQAILTKPSPSHLPSAFATAVITPSLCRCSATTNTGLHQNYIEGNSSHIQRTTHPHTTHPPVWIYCSRQMFNAPCAFLQVPSRSS